MNIRKAIVQDEKKIFQIHREAVENGCKGHYTDEQIASWAVPQGLPPFEELLESSLFLVAEIHNRCIGFGSFLKNKSEIMTLFVIPVFWGQGVGSELLRCLEQKIRQSGNKRIFLDSTINAISFYERHGYGFHSEVVHTEPDGTEIQCVKMIKNI